MILKDKWPEVGELVVGVVSRVEDFGAFVELDDFGKKKGLIHISEIAPGWIRHIRDHVKEGERVVCKVLEVDPNRGRIELSLKDVNEHQARERMHIWKNEQKAIKWLGLIAKKLGKDKDSFVEEIGQKLYDHFSGIYYAFDEAFEKGRKAFDKLDIDEEIIDEILATAQTNIKTPLMKISTQVMLSTIHPEGIEIIKKALKSAKRVTRRKDLTLDIRYIGAPRYLIVVESADYKNAEKILKKAADKAIEIIKMNEGEGYIIKA
ncbi:translation initiation factor IF-2 subunit alpha [Candidatus Methanoliparum sp. LAM-1]|uniref:translation initiation factor IF-2 subunit alpha n=1 Tax=Candidatus Methanoliparum sp. LAM-1 TaxID=2874846 RepID=UPI001E4E6A4A|nr:translation initiation factor IF-2 subunit alpha [Candidatus Methanoliparum sp. LAM-1]BDC36460.1 translation initiation factor IF-2 subunit alpha [Candidatus Methanoliparum sp. LAM-1]